MHRTVLRICSCSIFVILLGCGSVPPRKDFLFFPVHLAQLSVDPIDDMTFDPETNTFGDVPESATAAFYRSDDMDSFKKTGCNPLYFLTAGKEEIKRFNPNRDDLLVMKTGFIPGSGYSFLGNERSYPNRYMKNIHFNMNESKGEYLDATIAIIAINIGSSPIRTIYIADAMTRFMTINGVIRQAVKDEFLPLNVELDGTAVVEHKVVEKDSRRIVVYHLLFGETGLAPGCCVEIVVPVRIPRSELSKDEYKVKD
jgi:hypothetical protein